MYNHDRARESVWERARGLFGCFKRVLLCFWPCWCSLMTDCLLAAYLFCDLFFGFIQCVYLFANICFVQCGICVRRYGFISRSSLSMCVCVRRKRRRNSNKCLRNHFRSTKWLIVFLHPVYSKWDHMTLMSRPETPAKICANKVQSHTHTHAHARTFQ